MLLFSAVITELSKQSTKPPPLFITTDHVSEPTTSYISLQVLTLSLLKLFHIYSHSLLLSLRGTQKEMSIRILMQHF